MFVNIVIPFKLQQTIPLGLLESPDRPDAPAEILKYRSMDTRDLVMIMIIVLVSMMLLMITKVLNWNATIITRSLENTPIIAEQVNGACPIYQCADHYVTSGNCLASHLYRIVHC